MRKGAGFKTGEFREYLENAILRVGPLPPANDPTIKPLAMWLKANINTTSRKEYVDGLSTVLSQFFLEAKFPQHVSAYLLYLAGADELVLSEAWSKVYGGTQVEMERLVQAGDQLAKECGGAALERAEAQAVTIRMFRDQMMKIGMDEAERIGYYKQVFDRFAPETGVVYVAYMLMKAGVPGDEIMEANQMWFDENPEWTRNKRRQRRR